MNCHMFGIIIGIWGTNYFLTGAKRREWGRGPEQQSSQTVESIGKHGKNIRETVENMENVPTATGAKRTKWRNDPS